MITPAKFSMNMGLLPLVFNVFSNNIFNESIVAVHLVQVEPVERVLACSLLQCRERLGRGPNDN